MPRLNTLNVRRLATFLVLAICSLFAIALTLPANQAQANGYTSSGGGFTANTPGIELHYVWKSNGDTFPVCVQGNKNLRAIWTNTANSESFNIAINDSAVDSDIRFTTMPANTWSAGTKVSLVITSSPTASPSLVRLVGLQNKNNGPGSDACYQGNSRLWEVVSLGQFQPFTSLDYAFQGSTSSLRVTAQLPPTVTSLVGTFASSGFRESLSGWDTTNVQKMNSMFSSNTFFNQPLNTWTTSNVTDMDNMFYNATAFNQNLSGWNVSKVTDMSSMFSGASNFNNGDQTTSFAVSGAAPLTWDTPSLSSVTYLFNNAKVFNQNLNTWNVSQVSNFSYAFYGASFFNNGDARGASNTTTNVDMTWDMSSAQNLDSMFRLGTSFNQDLNGWNLSKVSNLSNVFVSATNFNNGDPFGAFAGDSSQSDVSMTWSTSSVSDMSSIFQGAVTFNQDLNSWSTSSLLRMGLAFSGAQYFNNGDPVGAFDGAGGTDTAMTWTTPTLIDLDSAFNTAYRFNQNLNTWNVSKVSKFNSAFAQAIRFNNGDPAGAFDGDARGSDVRMSWSPNAASTVDMSNIFSGAADFNQDLNSWSVSKVTKFSYAFQGATRFNNGDPAGAFDGDTRSSDVRMSWSPNAAVNMDYIFQDATNFNQDLNSWSVSKVTVLNNAFQGATRFNNGDPAGAFDGDTRSSDVRMSWSPMLLGNMSSAFSGATSFNQNLNSWNVSKATNFSWAFFRASNFNNGDSPAAYEGDPSNSNVVMSWDTRSASNMIRMFSEATNFNQNISAWNVRQVTTLAYFAGSTQSNGIFNNGAASASSNAMSWSTSTISSAIYAFSRQVNFNADISSWRFNKPTTLQGLFAGATGFNRDLSGWDTTLVTDLSFMFQNATSFNRPIGSWTISNVTTFASMFDGATAFNQDLSTWGPFRSDVSFQNMFASATSMGGSPQNWDLTKLGSTNTSAMTSIFGPSRSPSSSAISGPAIRSMLLGWSFQDIPQQLNVGFVNEALYTNCAEWSAYRRLIDINRWTFTHSSAALPSGVGCSTRIVTWAPSTSIAVSSGTFTPNTLATTTGPSGVRYIRYNPGTSNCSVNATTGAITHATSGSCRIMAYDADSNSVSSGQGYVIRTFTLPVPVVSPTPSAPGISTASATASSVTVLFNAPSESGTAPLAGYEVGYSLSFGGATTWVTVSPVVTSSPTVSYTLSGLTNGTSYWLKVRAFNANGTGPASNEIGPLTPASSPSAPSIASFTRGSGQIQFSISPPITNGGAPITRYEYRFDTTSTGVESQSWLVAASTLSPVLITGLTNGQNYFFQVRAVNGVGASLPSTTSAGVSPITTASAPVIVTSNKAGHSTNATIEFLAPASDGGDPISGYEIRFSTNEGVNWAAWQSASATLNPSTQRWDVSLTGLQGSALLPTYYNFEVRARNSVGVSAASTQIPSGAPINSVSFGNQSATVSFRAARYDGNSPILGYEYMLREGPSSSPTSVSSWISISSTIWQQATPTTTASFAITGLTNGNTYTVWVRAVNALGGLTADYENWLNNTGVPNKGIATLSFDYGITAVSYSPNASYSPSVTAVSDGAFSYTTSTPLVCSVNSSTGRISGLNAGTCLVTLSQAEGTHHQPATASTQVRIDPSNQPTLTVSASANTSPYRSTVTLTSSGGAGTGAVTFTPVASSTCVVAGNVVTLGNAGSFCAVIANKAGDGNYLAATSTQISISTTKIAQSAVSFSNLAEMSARSTLTIFATGGSGEGVMRYRVSNQGTTGCVLTGTTLTADTSGQCTIEASRATSTNYLVSDSVSQVIQVVKAAQTLRFTTNVPSEPLTGTSYSPAATASSGLSISFSVSGSGCSINAGVVSFTAAGDCVVSAGQAGDASYLNAVTVSQTIAVDRRNQTLTFGSSTQAISSKRYGDAAFVVQANSTDQTASVSFTLSPLTINNACSVFASGLVIVQNVGDCVIEAYSPQTGALAAASTISKVIAVLPDNASAPFITSVAMGNLSITAGFTPPSYFGGSSVSAYSIVAIDQTPNSTVEVSDSSCGTALVNGQVSCRITGLENGKTYKIKVAAINGAGVGEYSALSPSITVATNPAAVQNLRVVQGSTTLAISWDDPDSLGGGTFSAYRVFVKRSASSSYDVNHYFNVPSQATRNITISAETPPDGMTHPGGPALVNGVAYDIKVVTVTTANTEELTGNTAVVNQIPRTTPEPPRLANALVVGNKLVLTWTAPISDGGAAITTYSAVVGNSPCLFANPTDTYCEIALPTAPGNYVFAIAAQNVAGSSTEIQGVFTVASYNSSTPQTSGGSVVTDPVKPSESAPIVSSVSLSVDAKQIFIRGTFLKGISKVVIGGVEARIVSQTSEMIILTAPALAAGSHAVLIHLTDKTILRYEKELVVKGTKPAPVVKKTAKLTGFKPGSAVLSTAMKNSLIKVFKANKGSKTLQCIGHTQGPSILKSDARLAMKRAVAVCDFAKKQGFKVASPSYQNNRKVGAQFRRVDLVFAR